MLSPRDEQDLADCLAARSAPVEIIGAATKRAVGRPVEAELLSVAALAGILAYHPEELVLTARAATPLATIVDALAASGQRLAFEPCDHNVLLNAEGCQTLGGVLSANLAGSRRVTAGAARDHFLGFRAVNGRGECFKAGGQVVKNVTGYDLPKLLAGAWGTLAVLTEVTVRAVPLAEHECTLALPERSAANAVRLMTQALGSTHEVSAAAYDPATERVLLRLEGFAPSVAARAAALAKSCDSDAMERIEGPASRTLWRELGGAASLADCDCVWRLSVPPTDAPRVLEQLGASRYLLDWGGGLIWYGDAQVDATKVRDSLRAGSHATLMKASPADRARVPVFQPQSPALTALAARIKHAFDPRGLLNPGRMD
jgi:glycolate oxidase FAD binding subunit